jgi:DNA-binding ferritin-like protein
MVNRMEKEFREVNRKVFQWENCAIYQDVKLRNLIDIHNSVDEYLDDIIDMQNKSSDRLRDLQQEILTSKGMENSEDSEDIEEIYKREARILEFKKGIEKSLKTFEENFVLEKNSGDEFRDALMNIWYLKGKVVRNMQKMLEAKMESLLEIL